MMVQKSTGQTAERLARREVAPVAWTSLAALTAISEGRSAWMFPVKDGDDLVGAIPLYADPPAATEPGFMGAQKRSETDVVALAAAAKLILSQPKAPDSPIAGPFRVACSYLEDEECGAEITNEIIETFLRELTEVMAEGWT